MLTGFSRFLELVKDSPGLWESSQCVEWGERVSLGWNFGTLAFPSVIEVEVSCSYRACRSATALAILGLWPIGYSAHLFLIRLSRGS